LRFEEEAVVGGVEFDEETEDVEDDKRLEAVVASDSRVPIEVRARFDEELGDSRSRFPVQSCRSRVEFGEGELRKGGEVTVGAEVRVTS